MGGIVAPLLAKAGLRVVGLEAGPWRSKESFIPDELGSAYYCRANMGPKFLAEVPRWRRSEEEPTQEATFSLGRMMNAVGGSVIHYGAWLRRYHPHHFRPLSTWREAGVEHLLPEHSTLADWPVTYEDLEPYYTQVEYTVGVAGNDENSFISRSRPYPMPPLRPFRLGELFRTATKAMNLHPHPVPVGVNSVPYGGRRRRSTPRGATGSALTSTTSGIQRSRLFLKHWRRETSNCARAAVCCAFVPIVMGMQVG